MNARNTTVRLIFAATSLICTVMTLGSVLALADHYGSEALKAQPATLVAQRF